MATSAIPVRGIHTVSASTTVDTITLGGSLVGETVWEMVAVDGAKTVFFNVGDGSQASPTVAGTGAEYIVAASPGWKVRFTVPSGATRTIKATADGGTAKVYLIRIF